MSGGALPLSLTFLEKIAPEPAVNTLFLLGLSWFAFIVAVGTCFCAIYFSREAIYRRLEIDQEIYEHFIKTTTENNMEGDMLPQGKNCHIKTLEILNRISITSLIVGILLMCSFALANIHSGKRGEERDHATQVNLNVNLSQIPKNDTAITNKQPSKAK